MAEGQQQSGITAQQQKDMQDLEKLGEQLGEKAKQNVINSAKKDMNNTKSVQLYTNNSVGHTNKLLSVLDITLGFAIVIAIPLILRKMTKNNIEKSKFSKFKYNYFGYAYKSLLLVYIGFIISVLFPSVVTAYIVCVIIGSIAYIHLKRKGKFSKLSSNIKNENLSNKNVEPGAVLGSLNGQLIIKQCKKPGNILVVGAPGKGKSQCLSIPTLLNWKGSALVVDIKRELYAYTHNVQAKKGKVIVFDPEQNGNAYDPIKECDTVDSCQFLARSLIPTPINTDPFWTSNAQNVLAAACFEANKKGKTLPEISERILLTDPEKLIEELTNSEYKEVRLLSSSVKGTPEKTMGGIFTELKNSIILFATDENIRRALGKSEWSAKTLEEGATIYLRVSEKQIETYKKVWNLIIVQVLRHLNSRGEHKDPAILLLLDELPRLGKVEGYIESLGTLRSKDVTIFSAAQSLAQFQLYYGKEATRIIMDTNSYKVCLSASDDETQQIFSRLAGKFEREKTSVNANWSWGGGGAGKSKFKQWEDRFRPETLAYLEKPIFYPPDQEAFQIDKIYWMNVPYFFKLQEESGGPLTFISDKNFEKLSEFIREDTSEASTINNVVYESNNLEDEQNEKIYEPSHEAAVSTNKDDNVSKKENKEYIGPIKLFEKWKIK